MKQLNVAKILREEKDISLKDKLNIVYHLSIPGILAQISEIIMQYVDAAMVGSLGALASASIGLVSSSTWLYFGIFGATASGFAIQVAHSVGAGNHEKARDIFRQSVLSNIIVSLIAGLIGFSIASLLPKWLGAEEVLWKDAAAYFGCFCLFAPIRQLRNLGMNMLQCSGNMKIPSLYVTLECFLNVIFNFLLIFPSRTITLFGFSFPMIGAGLGVLGAQLGTCLSITVAMIGVMYYAMIISPILRLKGSRGRWLPERSVVGRALKIGVPMFLEHGALSFAQIVATRIVAPLGTIAIAANSFAVTAESICYMPGFGIAQASTTLVGQSIGANRKDYARSFAWLTTFSGIAVMSMAALLMYFLCPYVFGFMTPVREVQELGVAVLRIELLAEPLYACSIVATGALRGAEDTLVPGILNLISMWLIRLPLAYFLSLSMGLRGVWIAMAVELCARGCFMLVRMGRGKWLYER